MIWKKAENQDPRKYDEIMHGKCQICGTWVEIEKHKAVAPPEVKPVGKDPGIWNDLYYTECPTCKELSPTGASPRVYLLRKPGY